jgi:AbiJ N-terminal domain 3/Abortive infection C-terminus
MSSKDYRFANASQDIWQHRVRNNDWEDDWIFYDDRFDLLHAPDEEFLRFLCEILHPVVQPKAEEVERIRVILNDHLAEDGWELREQVQISGRSLFAAFRTIQSDSHTTEAIKVVADTIDAEYVSRQIIRMQSSLSSDPDAAIGAAKEFLETICKTILSERGIEYNPSESLPRLVKLVSGELDLIPKQVAQSSRANEVVKRLLSNLGSVADAVAEIRNLHGTGHGKEANTKGLSLRHGRLVAGAAASLAVFLFETHQESRQRHDSPKDLPF